MATYRDLLEVCVLGTDTTNAAAFVLKTDPARVAAALENMARSGAIEPVAEGTKRQHRWRLVMGAEYHHALHAVEQLGLVLDDSIP